MLNERRVFAVRAKSALTYADGRPRFRSTCSRRSAASDDLRGYRPFRFRGDNLMVMNAEYRWEVFSGLDMAVFARCRPGVHTQVRFRACATWRATSASASASTSATRRSCGWTSAFSHEGFQVWVKFSNIFKKGPVHTSSSMGDF